MKSKLTLVEDNLGNGWLRMHDNWLKKGDLVYNPRTSRIHEVLDDSRSLISISEPERINKGDTLQHI